MNKVILSLFIASNLFANTFTGEVKTACEVLLCLSTPNKPSECAAPLKHFFSIKHKKFWKTLDLRRSFLNLCPTGSTDNIEDDAIMTDLKEAIINIPHECTPEVFNRQYEYSTKQVFNESSNSYEDIKLIRITKNIPKTCVRFINNKYTDMTMPINTCSDRFFTSTEWNQGYYETIVYKTPSVRFPSRLDTMQIPNTVKELLAANKIYKSRINYKVGSGENSIAKMYYYDVYRQKHQINKKCWRYK
ncbi:hypothetical protein AVBRAN12640_07905 [Campylobacter sp. RM12640]|uniref:TrbM/KikA/MpfK family conjugal transfer protein n=1 Tax=unclassified Campylobacter TaxID=2593542 RepID=UPI001D591FE6|nr:hypothetical protein [Campylobacter sp. RM12642]MBZ7982458.1 hypothetical protein [Campylobacter sp. RM12640]MBZ7989963.1 hypothetical protein [Campylobacter sp. RM12635]MBZ8008224.1 hypothetical protein [Campylobacter sp. RM9334]